MKLSEIKQMIWEMEEPDYIYFKTHFKGYMINKNLAFLDSNMFSH